MTVNLSIKAVPDELAQRLRERAQHNHRSLQGELMAIIEQAAPQDVGAAVVAAAPVPVYRSGSVRTRRAGADLLAQIDAELGPAALAGGPWLSREAAHDRVVLHVPNPPGSVASPRTAPVRPARGKGASPKPAR